MINPIIKTPDEIAIMRQGGRKLAHILNELAKEVKPGVALRILETKAQELMKDAGVKPAFLGYNGFGAALCVSLNEEIVHGTADRDLVVQDGDVVSLDTGIECEGLIVDEAVTVLCRGERPFAPTGKNREAEKLISTCRTALQVGIEKVRAGATTGDIGSAIQAYVEKRGFGVVRDLVGHGVGKSLHESPEVPNFDIGGEGAKLSAGMTIAIEPMITAGDWRTKTLPDDWTVVTKDGSLSAHFEHTVLVTEKGCEILTKWE